MTTSQKLKAKIYSQIEKILTRQGEASDVVIAVYTRNKCVEITLNNDNPFTIAYNKRRDILDDSKKWHKLLNDKVNRELKNKSHNSLYIVYVKNDTTLPELTGLENVAIKKIVSENTLFCYGAILYRKLIRTAYSLEVIKRMAKQFEIINYLIVINDK